MKKVRAANKQSGVALIFALVIVSVVAAVSVKLAANHDRSIWRTEARWHGLQAKQYLLGAEQLAIFALNEDYKDDQEQGFFTDLMLEPWAEIVELPLDEGGIRGQLDDRQRLLDLNRLAVKAPDYANFGALDTKRFTEDQRRLIRLLQTFEDLNIDLPQAVEITEAIVDWIDPDSTPFGFGGAESLYYAANEPVIEPPNHPMDSVSELRLIRHMTPELYRVLAPKVTVLDGGQGLNVNTAPLEVMRCLGANNSLQPMPETDAQLIMDDRGVDGFTDLGMFSQQSVLSGLAGSQGSSFDDTGLTVSSDFFELTSEVSVVEQRRTLYSLLKRDSGKTRVVQRSRHPL